MSHMSTSARARCAVTPEPRLRDVVVFSLIVAPVVLLVVLGAAGFFEVVP